MNKNQRQHKITDLLRNQPVTNQGQLVELLEHEGVVATQATVSRDLDELGAVKVKMGGGDAVYAIPENPADRVVPEDLLKRVLSNWVVDIQSSANIVVIRTPPGSAHVVASAIDRAGMPDVLGTVAGADTMFVVTYEGTDGKDLAARFKEIAGL
ncbi:MAG: arginine repressor [Acidimicrobiia bacterium]